MEVMSEELGEVPETMIVEAWQTGFPAMARRRSKTNNSL